MKFPLFIAVGFLTLLSFSGCATLPTRLSPAQEAAAKPALAKLQAAAFEEAGAEAQAVLAKDPKNSQARVVAAMTHYKKTMHNFIRDMMTNITGMMAARSINHRYIKWSLDQTDKELARVEAHLAVAADDPGFHLALCLACWEYDWNHSGRVDDRDRMLLQVEQDAEGQSIPKDDPRRKPTFRFDHGDLYWARAMIAFQRAAMNLGMAYQLPDFDAFNRLQRESVLTIRMVDKARVLAARDLILAGLAHADRSRLLYLAETDDQGEWFPNPKQHNHPLPLPVDQALYDTWAGVLGDLQKLLRGEEGISVVEAAQLGDHQWADPPTGFVNVAKLFTAPGDITLNLKNLEAVDRNRSKADVERVLTDILGDKYVPSMKPSGILARFARMKSELERGEDSLERKLRYLLWVN